MSAHTFHLLTVHYVLYLHTPTYQTCSPFCIYSPHNSVDMHGCIYTMTGEYCYNDWTGLDWIHNYTCLFSPASVYVCADRGQRSIPIILKPLSRISINTCSVYIYIYNILYIYLYVHTVNIILLLLDVVSGSAIEISSI